MKKYTKEDLLLLLEDNNNFHKEIKETKGYVLFLMRKHSIDINPDELLVPHMSAWCIPYLNEKKSSLNDEQQNILTQVAQGKNYWVRNKLIDLNLDIQPFTERFSVNDKILKRIKEVNNENLENKLLLRRLSKSIDIEPIKNQEELIVVLNNLTELLLLLKEDNYQEGIKILRESIYKAIEVGGYQLNKDNVVQLPVVWINDFSLMLFNNIESTVRRLELSFNKFIQNYKIISKMDISPLEKVKMYNNIGFLENLSMDIKTLTIQLKNEREHLDKKDLHNVISNFMSSYRGLVSSQFKTIDIFFDYGLFELSKEDEYIGIHNYINLSTVKRVMDVKAWQQYMKNNELEKLPLGVLWDIGKGLQVGYETSELENLEELAYFLKDNISWSDFPDVDIFELTNDTNHLESLEKITNILWIIFDKIKLDNPNDSKQIQMILNHIYEKVDNLNRYSDEDDVRYLLSKMRRDIDVRELSFFHLGSLKNNPNSNEMFSKSIYMLDSNNISKFSHMNFNNKEWSLILNYNHMVNDNLISISKSIEVIPSKIFEIFLDYQKNTGSEIIKNYCENYVMHNWNNLNLDLMRKLKENYYNLSIDVRNLDIPLDDIYANVYNYAHLNRNKGFNFSLTVSEAIKKLNEVKLFDYKDMVSHLLFISNNIKDDSQGLERFIKEVNKLNITVSEFNEVFVNSILKKSELGFLNSVKQYQDLYLVNNSVEDFYSFILSYIKNRESLISYEETQDCHKFIESLDVDCRKLFKLIPFESFINLLRSSKDISDSLDLEFMKEIVNKFPEIESLAFSSLHNIFEAIFDKKIEKIIEKSKDNVDNVSQDIKELYINKLKSLESEPLVYLLFATSSKNMLMEVWKYDKNDNSSIKSDEYRHIIFNEYVNIDIFNKGISELQKILKHFNYNHLETGELMDLSSKINEEFDVVFRRIYNMTWASCKTKDENYDYKNKSLMSMENKDKVWSYIEDNFPHFFINMDACNVSTVGFDDVQIKNWFEIFNMLSSSIGSDGNYRNVDKKNAEMMLDSFLNYDANNNFEALEYLQNLIYMAKNSDIIKYEYNSEAKYKLIDEKTPAITDWNDVKILKESLLLKYLLMNDLRVREINALYEYNYLNNAIESNVTTKSSVFKV